MKKLTVLMVIVLFLTIGAKCHKAPRPGDYQFTIPGYTATGESLPTPREYSVHVPPGLKDRDKYPVVFVLHGGYGSGVSTERQTLLSHKSDESKFILIYPEAVKGGIDPNSGLQYKHWNGGPRDDPNKSPNVDDVRFINDIITEITEKYAVDPKRIYVAGISNGGTLTYMLACRSSHRIAAFATIATTQLDISCRIITSLPTPTPIIHIHGGSDSLLLYKGGVGPWPHVTDDFRPIWPGDPDSVIREWVVRNGNTLADVREIFREGTSVGVAYGTGRGEVQLYVDAEAGHTWPGGTYDAAPSCYEDPESSTCKLWKYIVGPISQDLNANDLIWEFFKNHPMD